jgi:colanic acid biosynthesis glycosyl transferase WcaI
MKILLYSLNFHPEIIGVGKYSGELAKTLNDYGNEVRVVASQPYYPAWSVFRGYKGHRYTAEMLSEKNFGDAGDRCKKSKVYRCPIWVPKKTSGVKRILMQLSFTISSLPVLALNIFWRPDIIIVVEPTLFCAPSTLLLAFLTKAKSWLHIQDFEIDAAFSLGILKGKFLKYILKSFESTIVRKFSVVSTISNEMLRTLSYNRVQDSKTYLMPNWVDLNLIKPSLLRNDILSQIKDRLNIPNEYFVAMYSGNMGKKQGLEMLCEAATLAKNDKIFFLFCGDGSGKLELMQKTKTLNNVSFLPLQDEKSFCDLITSVDLHLLPQRADLSNYVLPSKLTGMLASGRPIVATAKQGSELERIVSCCGIVTTPGSPDDFYRAIYELSRNQDLSNNLGIAARSYAEKYLNRGLIIQAAHERMRLVTGK